MLSKPSTLRSASRFSLTPPAVSSPDALGVSRFQPLKPMKELTDIMTPNASEEVLISREVTFRNSTFGALKTFMREHKRCTGVTLSNAAALDMILRSFLAQHIHPDAVKTMVSLSRRGSERALQEAPEQDLGEQGQEVAAQSPRQGPPQIRVALPTHRRPFVKPRQTPQDPA